MKAALATEDGTYIEGSAFGAANDGKIAVGELVFNTSMTGYVEALTDPGSAGQILMMTYPLIGNYGVCREDFESTGVKVEGFVVRELCKSPSNWRSQLSLDELLKEYDVLGIEGIDTRALTKKTRINGAMKAVLAVGDIEKEELIKRAIEQPSITELDLVDGVCIDTVKRIETGTDARGSGRERSRGRYEVVVIDCGIKTSIVRQLLKRGVNLTIVPFNYQAAKISRLDPEPDGLFISNGPGDPARVRPTIETIKNLAGEIPIAGISLGHQLISLAMGAETFKLRFGHRGANQPVKNFESGRVFITSQNHGFAVDDETLPERLTVTEINLNDRTVEGLKHEDFPIITVQYHQKTSPVPDETHFFFEQFVKMLG